MDANTTPTATPANQAGNSAPDPTADKAATDPVKPEPPMLDADSSPEQIEAFIQALPYDRLTTWWGHCPRIAESINQRWSKGK